MAISLASGVLVSTILTLVVIPLGCVAASKDLCEVAVATAPSGANVPCSSPEVAEERKVTKKPKGNRLITVWGYVVEGITIAFYLVRGIYLLLFDFAKGLFKKTKSVRKSTPPPPPRASGGSGGSAGAPPGASGTGTGNASAVAGARPVASSQASPTPGPEASAPPPAPEASRSTEAPAARSETAQVAPAADVKRAVPKPAPIQASQEGPDAKTDPAPVTDAVPASGADAPATKKASPKKGGAKKSADAAASRKKTAAKKRVAKKASATSDQAKPALVQKKAARRGIRLKVDDGQGPSFD